MSDTSEVVKQNLNPSAPVFVPDTRAFCESDTRASCESKKPSCDADTLVSCTSDAPVFSMSDTADSSCVLTVSSIASLCLEFSNLFDCEQFFRTTKHRTFHYIHTTGPPCSKDGNTYG